MDTPVLIIGGGPIGLTASALLSQHGVSSILVEKRPDTSQHPRARSVDMRTMEVFRQLGVADAMRGDALPAEWTRDVLFVETLNGKEVARLPTPDFHSVPHDTSPEVPLMTSQDRIEPVLLDRARREAWADVRFGTELVELVPGPDGVRALVRDLSSGREEEIRAAYAIGADGVQSRIREQLGLDLEGVMGVGTIYDVLFQGDLSPWVGDRFGSLLFVNHSGGTGIFQPLDAKSRWRCQITRFAAEMAEDEVTPGLCESWIANAAGAGDAVPGLHVDSVVSWTLNAAHASSLRKGRVLLAGDAAHVFFPTGGLGMNSGIHGIHNLAWKLALVVQGKASEALLDTYEEERLPAVSRNLACSQENAARSLGIFAANDAGSDIDEAVERAGQYANFQGLIFGCEYESRLCLPADAPAPKVADPIRDFEPQVRPGRRFPHVWLVQDRSRSTLDLAGPEFALISVDPAEKWHTAADGLGSLIRSEPLSADVGNDSALSALRGHVALVRPDGVVAALWPLNVSEPSELLRTYVNELGR